MSHFIPSYSIIPSDHNRPVQTAFILHGILGSGKNWRSFARRLTQGTSGWQFVLVDLRNHGESINSTPPHTLSACGADLAALADHLNAWPRAVIGHSFGGKVALSYAARSPMDLEQVWVLDAHPSAQPDILATPSESEVMQVIAGLRSIPLPIAKRQDVVDQLVEAGFSLPLALWMTTNLRRQKLGFDWRFDLDAAEEMMRDYLASDLWDAIFDSPIRFDFVRAERSAMWRPEVLEDFAEVAAIGQLRLHLLADSDHWVHRDNPEGLLALILPSLSLISERS